MPSLYLAQQYGIVNKDPFETPAQYTFGYAFKKDVRFPKVIELTGTNPILFSSLEEARLYLQRLEIHNVPNIDIIATIYDHSYPEYSIAQREQFDWTGVLQIAEFTSSLERTFSIIE